MGCSASSHHLIQIWSWLEKTVGAIADIIWITNIQAAKRFLKQTLQSTWSHCRKKTNWINTKIFSRNRTSCSHVEINQGRCPIRSQNHIFYRCPVFQALPLTERKVRVLKVNLCLNCFGCHFCTDCPSEKRCQICQGKHHSIIHIDDSIHSTRDTSVPIKTITIYGRAASSKADQPHPSASKEAQASHQQWLSESPHIFTFTL